MDFSGYLIRNRSQFWFVGFGFGGASAAEGDGMTVFSWCKSFFSFPSVGDGSRWKREEASLLLLRYYRVGEIGT